MGWRAAHIAPAPTSLYELIVTDVAVSGSNLGAFPSGVGSPDAVGYGDGRWLVIDNGTRELWRFNPDDPGDESGVYGLVGDFPSGLTQPNGIGYGDGRWLAIDIFSREIWRLNPDDPGDESGVYGLVGALPSGPFPNSIGYGDGRWLAVDVTLDGLWKVQPGRSRRRVRRLWTGR